MSDRSLREPIHVGKLYHERTVSGLSRVSAWVGEEILWFETADTQLDRSPEGFASALLVPAMSHGRDLVFEDPLCPVWLHNILELMDNFSRWWGWKPIRVLSTSPIETLPVPVKAEGRALCFSGGVDSFYSLLTYPQPINTLVMVHGFDLHLDDVEGACIAFGHARKVAAAKGLDAVMIATNYREHSQAGKKYKNAYVGALSGVGQLLPGVGELLISSSYRYDEAKPDGSHWQTDPLWSSAAMKVVHYGADLTRDEKLRAIAFEPLLKKHLRVCQANMNRTFHISKQSLNCGKCQKCVRTLLVMGQEVGTDGMEMFENKKNLDFYLYDETYVGGYLYKSYQEICRRGVDEKCKLSIKALMRRSAIMNKTEWAGRWCNKLIYRLLRMFDSIERKIHT